jgi:succinyl-CoA synthetase beta subunit
VHIPADRALELLRSYGIAAAKVDEGPDLHPSWRVAIAVDRDSERVALMASRRGDGPTERVIIDPMTGLTAAQAEAVAHRIGVPEAALPQARTCLQGLARLFDERDALLAAIDHLALTGEGRLVALDARLDIDPNALFRHPEIAAWRDPGEEDADEIEASAFDLTYIRLDGNIGCLVNGAGLAMATMDLIKLVGGKPANFLDVGGSATTEQVSEAFTLMMRNRRLAAILVNIFGGIMKCDVIATGIVDAVRRVDLTVPLVVRMQGTNEKLGKKILTTSGLPIVAAHDMADAAIKVVRAAAGK